MRLSSMFTASVIPRDPQVSTDVDPDTEDPPRPPMRPVRAPGLTPELSGPDRQAGASAAIGVAGAELAQLVTEVARGHQHASGQVCPLCVAAIGRYRVNATTDEADGGTASAVVDGIEASRGNDGVTA